MMFPYVLFVMSEWCASSCQVSHGIVVFGNCEKISSACVYGPRRDDGWLGGGGGRFSDNDAIIVRLSAKLTCGVHREMFVQSALSLLGRKSDMRGHWRM